MKIPFISFFKKPLDSVANEITSKVRTPFITTYIFVWIVKNNIFIYNLFFNDLLIDKTDVLEKQFNIYCQGFYISIAWTLIIALGVLLVFYIFINLSRIITVVSEERIRLNLLEVLKSKSITSVDDVDFWRSKSEELTKVNRKLDDDISSLLDTKKRIHEDLESIDKEYVALLKARDKAVVNINRELEEDFLLNKEMLEVSEVIKKELSSLEKVGELPTLTNLEDLPTFITV